MLGGENIKLNEGAFIKFPKEILDISKDIPLIVPTYIYVYIRRGLDDVIDTSINKILSFSRRKPDRHKNKTLEQYSLALQWLLGSEYIYIDEDLSMCGLRDDIHITINRDVVDTIERFGLIYLNEYYCIRDHIVENKLGASSSIIWRTFLYIRLNMSKRTGDKIQNKKANPEMYYNTYRGLEYKLKHHWQSISKANNVLNSSGVLYSEELPHFQNDNGEWRSRVHIFVNKYEGWEQELAWGRKHILKEKNNGK